MCEKITEKFYWKYFGVSIWDAVAYFKRLYYETGSKYCCTCLQMSRLLAILSLIYAKEGRKILSSVLDNDENRYFELLAYSTYTTENGRDYSLNCDETIKEEEFIINSEPEQFFVFNELNSEVKMVIKDVFMNFGKYTFGSLSKYLKEILDKMVDDNNESIINLEKIYYVIYYEKFDNNPIFEYLKSRTIGTIINSSNHAVDSEKIKIKDKCERGIK